MKLSTLIATALTLSDCNAYSSARRGGRPQNIIQDADKRDLLQDIVTWDEHSLFIRGERVMLFSGEVHPFRMPNPSLFLDVFQKIKALGLNAVSFYIDWALLEGTPGEFRGDGIFDLQAFFDAATEAGIYLLARPGPYINAETSGGGFPGWLQRVNALLRTADPGFIHATDNYVANIAGIIAEAQVTNGGPVILYQPENEYSVGDGVEFPDQDYLSYVNKQVRDAGVVVPLINNDAWPGGTGAPGTGKGAVDIYGHDGYPVGFDCANPYVWPEGNLPTDWHQSHLDISPNTPYSILEFQGGAFDPFGGWGFEQCSILVNHEFERVFYKNNFAAGVTIFNIYMIFGGTNWGNLGHPGGYTSYDYGSAIREDRRVDREKYSELKLQAQFMKVSPGYLTTTVHNLTSGVYSSNKNIAVTPLLGEKQGSFFVVRHSNYSSLASTSYRLKLPTSAGELSIPQLGGKLSLNGRDSKIHVTDYPVGDFTLLYSTAEVVTWKKFHDRTVLILYGGPDEMHEVAIQGAMHYRQVRGSGKVKVESRSDFVVLQWTTSPSRAVVSAHGLQIYLLNRNSAYNLWVPDLPGKGDAPPSYGTSIMNPDSVIVNGGYLVRSVSVEDKTLCLKADFNSTSSLEIIGAPKGVTKLSVNGAAFDYTVNDLGNWVSEVKFHHPNLDIPSLAMLEWHSVDSLPELRRSYDDSHWTVANLKKTKNTAWPLHTPTSLYGADYGYNTGTLVYRGHFTSSGEEAELALWTQGGSAYASSAWLDDTFLGSFIGYDAAPAANSTFAVPKLKRGKRYVLTILVDSNGFNENWTPGQDEMKQPRGIIDYALTSKLDARGRRTRTVISSWKLTGNLGGEDYVDHFRGPLNEGGLWFERQGLHLPGAPTGVFSGTSTPFEGLSEPGVAYYATKFSLDMPLNSFDVPMSFVFDNSTDANTSNNNNDGDGGGGGGAYRALLYVNGFQYGKYVSTIGPQTEFPVPEGILDYCGDNWIGVALWALEKKGARVPGLVLKVAPPVQTSRERVELVHGPRYSKRKHAY